MHRPMKCSSKYLVSLLKFDCQLESFPTLVRYHLVEISWTFPGLKLSIDTIIKWQCMNLTPGNQVNHEQTWSMWIIGTSFNFQRPKCTAWENILHMLGHQTHTLSSYSTLWHTKHSFSGDLPVSSLHNTLKYLYIYIYIPTINLPLN